MPAATTIDFSRSFLTFRIDTLAKPPQTVSHAPPYSLNNARIQLDCVCDLLHRPTGVAQRFVLGVSCKTERVGVPRDIWTAPNADFIPILSQDQFLNLKTYAYLGAEASVSLFGLNRPQPDRQTGSTHAAFDRLTLHVAESAAEELASPTEIIEATFGHRPLVALTERTHGDYAVRLWYPIKTFNVNERDGIYQTDTGPMLIPDLSLPPERVIEGFQLAFAAFNARDWIELQVRDVVDTPNGDRVYHYDRSVRWDDVSNRVFAL
ncbi:MAG: hypothetical protein U0939_21330 [Pirellulales bacterium]